MVIEENNIMKTIVGINSFNFGSTGKVMTSIAKQARANEIDYWVAVPTSRSTKKHNLINQLYIGNRLSRNISLLLGWMTGYQECYSILSTYSFLKKLNELKPDCIHLHNLHNGYLNLGMLFRYIKKHHIPVVWTLHDCWAFTGQCPHFTMVKCERWKTGCHDCSQINVYPASCVDITKTMWKLKKKWFTGVPNMTIVTPSQWLADLVKQSYLKDYPVKVINNGIDLNVFKPTESHFREEHGIKPNEHMLLGVAFDWGKRKGIDVFLELSKRLPINYRIVLVGTNDDIDKQLTDCIVSIHRTQNQAELAEIYTAADLFVNPTREEVLGLVNIEALSCGTPVLTFNTGGSPECIDETCGSVVQCDNVDAMEREIKSICETQRFSNEAFISHASRFDMKEKYSEYIALFEEVISLQSRV